MAAANNGYVRFPLVVSQLYETMKKAHEIDYELFNELTALKLTQNSQGGSQNKFSIKWIKVDLSSNKFTEYKSRADRVFMKKITDIAKKRWLLSESSANVT